MLVDLMRIQLFLMMDLAGKLRQVSCEYGWVFCAPSFLDPLGGVTPPSEI